MKLKINPDFIPPNPPGYVFATNCSDNKKSDSECAIECANWLGCINPEEILILVSLFNNGYQCRSAFVPEKYAEYVKARHEMIAELMNLMNELFDIDMD